MRSFKQYYKDRNHQEFGGYLKDNFTIQAFLSDKYISNNQNMVSRFQHCFAKGIQDNILLPKYLVIVPDDDLIHYFNYDGQGLTKPYGRLINNIMHEFDKLISVQKEFLPKRSRRPNYPSIIWIEPPLHDNFVNNQEQLKFIRVLNDVAKFHEGTVVLKLKKVWDQTDSNLFSSHFGRFTPDGYKA